MDGSHGHLFEQTIDGDSASERRDLRTKQENRKARSVITPRDGSKRSKPHNSSLKGSYYSKMRTCASCYITKPKKEFYNVAVEESLRKYDGFNIRCRACQKTQYSHGYKEDGFIVADSDNQNSVTLCESESDDDIVIPVRRSTSYHGYESDEGFIVPG
jgi:hypothetical protein